MFTACYDISVMQFPWPMVWKKRKAVSELWQKRGYFLNKKKSLYILLLCHPLKKPFIMCCFYTRPGPFTYLQNHALLYAHKTSYGPEDASIVNCVYKHLLTIKEKAHKRNTLLRRERERERNRKDMRRWWYLKKTEKNVVKAVQLFDYRTSETNKRAILIITECPMVLPPFMWKNCVIWPWKKKWNNCLFEFLSTSKLKTAQSLEWPYSLPTPLQVISRESFIVLLPWAQEQISLLLSCLFTARTTIMKKKKN